MGVLGHPQGFEAAFLERSSQWGGLHAVRGEEHHRTDFHGSSPRLLACLRGSHDCGKRQAIASPKRRPGGTVPGSKVIGGADHLSADEYLEHAEQIQSHQRNQYREDEQKLRTAEQQPPADLTTCRFNPDNQGGHGQE